MTRYSYDHFYRILKDVLILHGCTIEWDNKKCTAFRNVDELIYLPKKLDEYINIFFVKDNLIRDNYRSSDRKASMAVRRFMRWFKKRELRKILSNDNETKAYI